MIRRPIFLLAPALVAVTASFTVGGVGAAASPGSAATGGLTHVVDDTGSIAVSVPAGWTVDTAPMTSAGVALPEDRRPPGAGRLPHQHPRQRPRVRRGPGGRGMRRVVAAGRVHAV